MGWRSLIVSRPSTALKVTSNQLCLSSTIDGKKREAVIRPEDLDVVMVESIDAVVTAQAISLLSSHDVPVVFVSSRNYAPESIVINAYRPNVRLMAGWNRQCGLGDLEKLTLWKEVLKAKITGQGVFAGIDPSPFLESLDSASTKEGCIAAEGAMARTYWGRVYGRHFRRKKRHDGEERGFVNSFLNYGYAVLRARTAAAIAAAGLHPGFGVYHSSAINPMALADDLMEPLRWVVDMVALERMEVDDRDDSLPKGLDGESFLAPADKRLAISTMRRRVFMPSKGKAFEVSEAVRISVLAFREALMSGNHEELYESLLCLPLK